MRSVSARLFVRVGVLSLGWFIAGTSLAGEFISPGHVYYQTDFANVNGWQGWSPKACSLVEGRNGGRALQIESPAATPQGSCVIRYSLPVEAMRGCRVGFSAWVKAENVSDRPKAWNGVKFMAAIESPEGNKWPGADTNIGSFDWQKIAFSARIPEDAKSIALTIGLEAVSGKVWFDDVRVWLIKPAIVRPTAKAEGLVYRGHDLPRLRGAMIPTSISADSLRTLGKKWNANLVRWQLIRPVSVVKDPLDLKAYDDWLQAELKRFDAALPICREAGLMVVLDLHSPPGGRPFQGGYIPANAGFFDNPHCQAKFIEVWQHIAARYKDNDTIWGFDLANEPVEDNVPQEGLADWQTLAERAAKAVRAIDSRHAIIVEPSSWGGPDGFVELQPIRVPNVVYSFHMYMPFVFTHQGVFQASKPVHYPGMIEGAFWDKARLEAAMKPAIDFQKAYGVHMYVGEFSAIRWAPDDSGYRYLKDLIDLFESHGWDWSYHAFREWDGWSVEHGPDRANCQPTATPTSRQELLMGWFSKNQKPVWAELGSQK
jgi:hypothetical protein